MWETVCQAQKPHWPNLLRKYTVFLIATHSSFLFLNPDALNAELSPCWCSASVAVYKNCQQSGASPSEEGFVLTLKLLAVKLMQNFYDEINILLG